MTKVQEGFMQLFVVVCSTRVSNGLGAGNPKAARNAVRVGMVLGMAEAVVTSTVFYFFRHVLGYAYSNEKEVVDYVAEMVPLLCLCVSADSLIGVLSGEFVRVHTPNFRTTFQFN